MLQGLRVGQLHVERLRNIDDADLHLAEGQNLIVGGNGQGKTTLLEALYLLGAVRSFRGARPAELVQHGAREAIVRGALGSREPASKVAITLTQHGRHIRVNGKRADLAEHFRRFPIVAFHPGDLDLVLGGPGTRRRFLDRMLFQAEAGYAQWYREYSRALKNRGELLKQNRSEKEIRAYDLLLASLGARMGASRARLVVLLAEATAVVLDRLMVQPFSMRLKVVVEPTEDGLLKALERTLPADRRRGRTSVGPHTDELELARETGLARCVASRGEARALAVSMRLGERKVISSCAATTPLLLLDDVWAELDSERAERVLALVESEPGQVVVTGTGGHVPRVVRQWSRFEVHQGRVVRAQGRESDVV